MTNVSLVQIWEVPAWCRHPGDWACNCGPYEAEVFIAGVVYDLGDDGLRAEVHSVAEGERILDLSEDQRLNAEDSLISEYERLHPVPFVKEAHV